jgi:hypothetical protein
VDAPNQELQKNYIRNGYTIKRCTSKESKALKRDTVMEFNRKVNI